MWFYLHRLSSAGLEAVPADTGESYTLDRSLLHQKACAIQYWLISLSKLRCFPNQVA